MLHTRIVIEFTRSNPEDDLTIRRHVQTILHQFAERTPLATGAPAGAFTIEHTSPRPK